MLFIPMLLIIGLLLLPKTIENEKYLTIFLILSFALFIFLWVSLQKTFLEINDNGLVYKNLFRTKEVLWQDVIKTYIKYEHHGKSGSHYWYFETTDGKKTRFRLSLFSRKNLQPIAQAVILKCSHAEVQDKIVNMASGKFPWYIF